MLNRKEIIEKAVHDCFREMYAKAQPSADFDKIVQEFKEGKRDKDERVYEQHYLSQEEYHYIVDKYINAYGMETHWKDDVEILEKYLAKGGSKEKYFPTTYDDDGNILEMHHRGYEDVPPLRNHIEDILNEHLKSDSNSELAATITDKVMELISTCKNFYRFDKEQSDFEITCSLGASPTSNPDTVKEYWKQKTGEDIQIEIRNPKLFWYRDAGYTDEDLAYEFEDYGENWKEALDKEWQEELNKRNSK